MAGYKIIYYKAEELDLLQLFNNNNIDVCPDVNEAEIYATDLSIVDKIKQMWYLYKVATNVPTQKKEWFNAG